MLGYARIVIFGILSTHNNRVTRYVQQVMHVIGVALLRFQMLCYRMSVSSLY